MYLCIIVHQVHQSLHQCVKYSMTVFFLNAFWSCHIKSNHKYHMKWLKTDQGHIVALSVSFLGFKNYSVKYKVATNPTKRTKQALCKYIPDLLHCLCQSRLKSICFYWRHTLLLKNIQMYIFMKQLDTVVFWKASFTRDKNCICLELFSAMD